jgi:fumarate reductase flavoprotein subunit
MKRWSIGLITVALVFVLAGCGSTSGGTTGGGGTGSSGGNRNITETLNDYDVVVVGVGSSGHAAMIAAVDTGARVIAIEQNGFAFPMMSAGIGAVESAQQKAARDSGNPNFQWFSKDDLFNTLMQYSHYTANGPLVRRVVDESGYNIDWLAERGLASTLTLGSDQGMHIRESYYKTYHMHNFGWITLQEYFTGKGGTLRLNTRALDLVMAPDGKTVAGIIAEDVNDGHLIQINAQQVILCTGGYGPATAKFDELLELGDVDIYAYGGEGNLGAGIEMAVGTAGAKLWGDHSFMLHNNVVRTVDGKENTELASSPIFFLYNAEFIPAVNTEGFRFMNEKLVSNSALWANSSYSQGGTYFIIFDQGIVSDMEKNGIQYPMWYIGGVSDPAATSLPPYTPPTQEEIDNIPNMWGLYAGLFDVASGFPVPADRFGGFSQAVQKFAGAGWIYSGNTLEELARNAGMNPEALTGSIGRYNQAVDTGVDTDFGKDKQFLTHRVSQGPFYAVRMTLTSLGGSSGGIMVNSNLQVLDDSYHAIPGLYAAGLNAGGFYGPVSTYYDYEGSAMMFATNSGRIAGTEAGKAVTR